MSAASWPARTIIAAQLLFEPHFVKAGRRQRFNAANLHEIADVVAREALSVNLEDVGVERQPVQCGDLCKIEIYCEIKSPLVNRSLAKPSRWVAEGFANIAGTSTLSDETLGLLKNPWLDRGIKLSVSVGVGGLMFFLFVFACFSL